MSDEQSWVDDLDDEMREELIRQIEEAQRGFGGGGEDE